MLSEALDIIIESRGNTVWLTLRGPFHKQQIPHIQGKLVSFIRDGIRDIVVDLEAVTIIHENVAAMFLDILNLMKGKNGSLKLIFKNDTVTRVFAPYKNIFPIYYDSKGATTTSFARFFKTWSKFVSRKTGIRISLPVAVFLLFILIGWFLSLGWIINMQKKQIADQQNEIQYIREWKQKTELELKALQTRLRPMEQLGLITDSLSNE